MLFFNFLATRHLSNFFSHSALLKTFLKYEFVYEFCISNFLANKGIYVRSAIFLIEVTENI